MGSYQRLQGTYTTLSYIVVFFLMLQGLRTRRQLNRVITISIVVSFPIALYGLVQHFGLDPLPWGGNVERRVASNMGNSIFVAAYMIMILPLTLSRLLENWRQTVDGFDLRDGLLGGLAFVLLAAALLTGMLLDLGEGMLWVRWVALLVGIALQVPIYLLSPAGRRSTVLAISLPLTFAFLVAFSWILELFFPPATSNYFWLGLIAIALFMTAMVAFASYLRKPVARLLLLSSYFVIAITQLICIFYTQSRGPLLGLLAGMAFFFVLLGLLKRRVILTWAVYVVSGGLLAFLIVFNTVDTPLIERLRETPYVGRLGRVLETEEGSGRVRVLIWQGAADMIDGHPPLQAPGEEPDPFNALRPIIGHGPESMYVAYNRFYPPDLAHYEKRNASPDRSHNETFDALVTTGWTGLVIYLFLFGSAIYFGLKWLGLVKENWQRWTYAGLWAGGAILGMIGAWAWRGEPYIGVGIPLGAMAGVAIYLFIVLVLATARPQRWLPTSRPLHWVVLALVSAIGAHFVEIQFGIAIAATNTYFWAYAAAMVVVGSRLLAAREPEAVVAQQAPAEPKRRSSRRRRRPAAPAAGDQGRGLDWLGSVAVLSLIGLLILSTIMFNTITPQDEGVGLLGTVWRSLTQREGEPSPVMLALLLSTWIVIAITGLSDLALHREARDKSMEDWLAAIGIFAGITLGGALLFALMHAVRLKPVTITSTSYSNPLSNTITFYYVNVIVHLVALALAFTFLSREARRTLPWRWGGKLADIGVISLAVILPVMLGIAINATNIRIVRADIIYKEGLSSERVNQWDGAIYLYEHALELAPSEDFYHLFLGRAYMQKAKTAQGEARDQWMQLSQNLLAEARRIAPLNTDHSRNMSKLYLSWGAMKQGAEAQALFDQALAYSADAVSLSPNTADVRNERAQVYLAMGDYPQAEETFQESLALDDEYVQTHMLLGQMYVEEKRWDDAVQQFERTVELKPKSGEAYSLLGYAYSQTDDLEKSLEAYQASARLRPNNYLDHQNLAILYNQLGRTDDAIREATQALALAPESQQQALQALLAQLGAGETATVSSTNAQEIQDLLTTGRAELQAEDWESAEATFLQVLELDASNVIAHSSLAYVYARQGRLQEAIAENQAVLAQRPNDYDSYKNLAILYQQMGSFDQAIENTEKALELAPEEDQEVLNTYLDQLRQAQEQSGKGATPAAEEPAATVGPDQKAGDLPPARRDNMYDSPPAMQIDTDRSYQATIVTEKGDIVVELYDDQAPTTVNNFVFLAREGFYDNTTFHRVIPGFMAQAGDPTGTGRGGPGYRFADEFDPSLRHDGPGILSMANAGANTNGSQFFITYVATPWLDDRHAVFGRVIEGLDVLEALTARDPQQNPSFEGDKILTITIEEK
jgi:cyclophilin family peptidyl-prolyl cis-trans isomerase/tetratricopeptide (TPR) repeat protein/O-antigen ligase